MADATKKPIAEGDNLGVESTTTSPETEKTGDDAARDEQAEAEHGNLSEAGGR
jgi:hypothetical protein